jgi:hypothetical protein
LFAVKYDDAKVLSFEIIDGNGDFTELLRLKLNDETEQMLVNLRGVSAFELLALLAKYPQDEV